MDTTEDLNGLMQPLVEKVVAFSAVPAAPPFEVLDARQEEDIELLRAEERDDAAAQIALADELVQRLVNRRDVGVWSGAQTDTRDRSDDVCATFEAALGLDEDDILFRCCSGGRGAWVLLRAAQEWERREEQVGRQVAFSDGATVRRLTRLKGLSRAYSIADSNQSSSGPVSAQHSLRRYKRAANKPPEEIAKLQIAALQNTLGVPEGESSLAVDMKIVESLASFERTRRFCDGMQLGDCGSVHALIAVIAMRPTLLCLRGEIRQDGRSNLRAQHAFLRRIDEALSHFPLPSLGPAPDPSFDPRKRKLSLQIPGTSSYFVPYSHWVLPLTSPQSKRTIETIPVWTERLHASIDGLLADGDPESFIDESDEPLLVCVFDSNPILVSLSSSKPCFRFLNERGATARFARCHRLPFAEEAFLESPLNELLETLEMPAGTAAPTPMSWSDWGYMGLEFLFRLPTSEPVSNSLGDLSSRAWDYQNFRVRNLEGWTGEWVAQQPPPTPDPLTQGNSSLERRMVPVLPSPRYPTPSAPPYTLYPTILSRLVSPFLSSPSLPSRPTIFLAPPAKPGSPTAPPRLPTRPTVFEPKGDGSPPSLPAPPTVLEPGDLRQGDIPGPQNEPNTPPTEDEKAEFFKDPQFLAALAVLVTQGYLYTIPNPYAAAVPQVGTYVRVTTSLSDRDALTREEMPEPSTEFIAAPTVDATRRITNPLQAVESLLTYGCSGKLSHRASVLIWNCERVVQCVLLMEPVACIGVRFPRPVIAAKAVPDAAAIERVRSRLLLKMRRAVVAHFSTYRNAYRGGEDVATRMDIGTRFTTPGRPKAWKIDASQWDSPVANTNEEILDYCRNIDRWVSEFAEGGVVLVNSSAEAEVRRLLFVHDDEESMRRLARVNDPQTNQIQQRNNRAAKKMNQVNRQMFAASVALAGAILSCIIDAPQLKLIEQEEKEEEEEAEELPTRYELFTRSRAVTTGTLSRT